MSTAVTDHLRDSAEALRLTSHATDEVRGEYAGRASHFYGGHRYTVVSPDECRALGYPGDGEEILIRRFSDGKVFTVWIAGCVQPIVNRPPLPGAGGAA